VPPPTAFGPRTPVLLAALVSAAFLGFLLSATGGHFVPPVTDLYVVCQYAKAMAEGHPFHYNAGEPASTGATSLLHTAILALAHVLGMRGEALVAFAVLLGIALFIASVVLATRLGTRLASPREGALTGALVALGGPVAWGFLYGSDIALFLFLALWLFERLVATWDGAIASAVAVACLLALARPEGLPIALILALAWWWRGRGGRISCGPGRKIYAGRNRRLGRTTGAFRTASLDRRGGRRQRGERRSLCGRRRRGACHLRALSRAAMRRAGADRPRARASLISRTPRRAHCQFSNENGFQPSVSISTAKATPRETS
jgi:hypothetical protein